MSSCGPASEEFALLTVDNILCAGAQFRGQQAKTSLQFSAQAMLEVLEYKMLTMQKLLAPCDISGVASIQPKPKVSHLKCIMRKQDFCHAADQHLCFYHVDSTIHLLPKPHF